jgi:HAD superfamily hydrolase (TIGR01509 family)
VVSAKKGEMPVMPLRAVTFDFHDTLVKCDDWFQLEVRLLVPALLAWAYERGLADDHGDRLDDAIARYRAIRRQVMDSGIERDTVSCALQVLDELNIALPEPDVQRGVDQLMRAALSTASPLPGAHQTVRRLSDAGLQLAVVSSAAHHDFIEWSLTEFGMREYFTAIVSSARCGYYKSSPRIYECALAELGVAPGDMVHVGDSLRFDVGSAGRVGICTVWFNHRQEPPDGIVPDLTIASLDGLAPRLLTMFAE